MQMLKCILSLMGGQWRHVFIRIARTEYGKIFEKGLSVKNMMKSYQMKLESEHHQYVDDG